MEASYRTHQGMESIPAYVEDTGEVNWLVADAMHMEVPIPVIAESVMQLFASRDNNKQWAIVMMRNRFGDRTRAERGARGRFL
jgi:6-phosphogluconate dehydrogenase